MMPIELTVIYFSATDTTRKCVDTVAASLGLPLGKSINLADRGAVEFPELGQQDVLLIGMPVYGGRIPALAVNKIKSLRGNGAKAIAMVVYGNRDYDDALLELTDLLAEQGFTVVSAAAFIGQHSIFPKVGTSRPDDSDIRELTRFGYNCGEILKSNTTPALNIKGARPYKKYGGVPVHPVGNRKKCRECGQCVSLCPVEAIERSTPWQNDPEKCISCGRCIAVCTNSAREYKGLKYSLIAAIFKASFSKRKAPETFPDIPSSI